MKNPFVYLALLAYLHLGGGYGNDELRQIIDQSAYDQGVSAPLMECMAWRESTGTYMVFDPYAMSPTNDFGLYQFHEFPDGSSLLDDVPDYIASGTFWNMAMNPKMSSEAASWLVARGYGPRWAVWWLCQ